MTLKEYVNKIGRERACVALDCTYPALISWLRGSRRPGRLVLKSFIQKGIDTKEWNS